MPEFGSQAVTNLNSGESRHCFLIYYLYSRSRQTSGNLQVNWLNSGESQLTDKRSHSNRYQ